MDKLICFCLTSSPNIKDLRLTQSKSPWLLSKVDVEPKPDELTQLSEKSNINNCFKIMNYLWFNSGDTMRSCWSVRMASIHGITLGSVIIVTLMPFTSIKLVSMNRFDVFSKRTWVGIAFGTAWSFARIRFLWSRIKKNNVIKIFLFDHRLLDQFFISFF